MKQKLITLFFALFASAGTLFAQSGTCGDNLTWTLSNGTLTISGTGSMKSYNSFFSPWYDYRSSITNVIINSGVTSIGGRAFSGCTGLPSITIPNSVTSIGDQAFSGCTGLTSVTIPNSVTSIGSSAFSGCGDLKLVTLHSNAIVGKSYTYESTLVNIFGSQVKEYLIGNSVTSIGKYAFCRCTGLTSITIPNNVTSIGFGAFQGCSNLTSSITIPNSVTSIGQYAFYSCSNLTSVTLHSNAIVSKSYTSSSSLANIFGTQVKEYVIGDDVKSIGQYAFYGCSGLTSITIPNSVTSIGLYAFSGCTSLPMIDNIRYAHTYLVEAVDKTLSSYKIKEGTRFIGYNAFYNCSSLTSVTIGNSVTSIGQYAFKNCSRLTSVILHSNAIVGQSYTSSSSLTNIFGSQVKEYIIGDSVTSIGKYAFYRCSSLTSVTIPNSVTSIGEHAFENCPSLTSVHITDLATWCKIKFTNEYSNPLLYAQHLYVNDSEIKELIIPDNVREIGNYVFINGRGITSVLLHEKMTRIGIWAFAGCHSLKAISIPSNVSSVGEGAFLKCTGLTSVQWNAKTCPDFTSTNTPFYLSDVVPSQITSFVFGEDVNDIPANLCRNMTNLTSVTLPNSVTSIGEMAFSGCSSLKDIFVPCGELDRFKQMDGADDRMKYVPSSYKIMAEEIENGAVSIPNYTSCDDSIEITAVPNTGYHFVQWKDGNTDSPRTVYLTEDQTFTAEFAKNTYTITTESNDSTWGTAAGGQAALYEDTIEISATANYGYHFARWDDGNTQNPRSVTVTDNKTYQAIFEKNIYSIKKNAVHGSVSGLSQAEYLDEVTLTVHPNNGYHFTQWSDGNTNNPRTFTLTQDTAFTAFFDYTLTDKCGKDNLLTWTLDTTKMSLNIIGRGSLTENYTYGSFIKSLVIGNEVASIGTDAFSDCNNLKDIVLGSALKIIESGAFACSDIKTITCYSKRPPTVNDGAFCNLDYSTVVYVLKDYVDAYETHAFWQWYDIHPIGASDTETDKVKVEPAETTATVAWPTINGAGSYELVIRDKDGNALCTLVFNAQGQLTSIDFAAAAAPARDRSNVAAMAQGAGFAFTVTGLESGTMYKYSFITKNASGAVIDTKTGAFTTQSPTALENIMDNVSSSSSVRKVLQNGQLYILRDGKVYNAVGAEVK